MTTTPPTAMQRLRQVVVLALAAAIAVRAIFIIASATREVSATPADVDIVTRGHYRLACLRSVIAPSSKVGYLDQDTGSRPWFVITQYVLAPVAVEQSTNHRYIVANFPSDEDLYAYVAPTRLKIVAWFGEGRAVLENQDIAK